MYTYIPTLLDYQGVSQLQSQSPALAYRWPKLPDKRKFESVAHKKLRFKLHMFPNSSYACITVSGFIFLHDTCCSLQTKRRESFLCQSDISESLIRWVFNLFNSLTDRSMFFSQHFSGGGGGGRVGDANKKEIFWGGVSSANAVAGGVLVWKKDLQIWDLQRLASLCIPGFSVKECD